MSSQVSLWVIHGSYRRTRESCMTYYWKWYKWIFGNIWFRQFGFSGWSALNIRANMCLFPHHWIWWGSERPWLPRSPDLNATDFLLWECTKSFVYSAVINTRTKLWQIIVVASKPYKKFTSITFSGSEKYAWNALMLIVDILTTYCKCFIF